MDDDDLLAELMPRLTRLSAALSRGRLVERAVAAAGIGPERPALSVLVTLHTADRPLRIGEIAARMEVVGPHVTRLVAGLEQRGLVHRVTDPLDLRARLIEQTPDGRAAVERYLGVVLGVFGDALAGWSDDDRRQLGRLLGRLVEDLVAHVATLDDPVSGP
jgi:DNA-binding MarR family transcriptional regulator